MGSKNTRGNGRNTGSNGNQRRNRGGQGNNRRQQKPQWSQEQLDAWACIHQSQEVRFAGGARGTVRFIRTTPDSPENAASLCWKVRGKWANVLVIWSEDGDGNCIGTAILGGQWVHLGVTASEANLDADGELTVDYLAEELQKVEPGCHKPTRQPHDQSVRHDTDRLVSGKSWPVQTAFKNMKKFFNFVRNNLSVAHLCLPPSEPRHRTEFMIEDWSCKVLLVNDLGGPVGRTGADIIIRRVRNDQERAGQVEIVVTDPQKAVFAEMIANQLNDVVDRGVPWSIRELPGGGTAVHRHNERPGRDFNGLYRALWLAMRSI